MNAEQREQRRFSYAADGLAAAIRCLHRKKTPCTLGCAPVGIRHASVRIRISPRLVGLYVAQWPPKQKHIGQRGAHNPDGVGEQVVPVKARAEGNCC